MNLYEIAAKKRGLKLYNQRGEAYDGTSGDPPIGVDSMGNEVLMNYPDHTSGDPITGDDPVLRGPPGVAGFQMPPSRTPDVPVAIPPYLSPTTRPAPTAADDYSRILGYDLQGYRGPTQEDIDDADADGALAHQGPYRQPALSVSIDDPSTYLRKKLLATQDQFQTPPVAAKVAKDEGGDEDSGDEGKDGDGDGEDQGGDGDQGDGDSGDDDDSGKNITGIDDQGHLILEPDGLSGDEDKTFNAAYNAMEDRQKMLDNGGPGYEVDWGPALALIDSWTGSHILNGYQHPARPLSPDELSREQLKNRLALYNTVSDARNDTLNRNLKRSTSNLQNDQSKLIYKQEKDEDARKQSAYDQGQALQKQIQDYLKDPAHNQKPYFQVDGSGRLSLIPYPNQKAPPTGFNPDVRGGRAATAQPDWVQPWNATHPNQQLLPNGRPAPRTAPAKASLPKMTKGELQDQSEAAYYARTGAKADKDDPSQQRGVQGYKTRILQIVNSAPDATTARAQIAALVHGEAVKRAQDGMQGTGALLNPNAPAMVERAANGD